MTAGWTIGASVVLCVGLTAVAAIDLRTYRIPDWLSLPMIVSGLAWAVFSGAPPASHVAGAAVGYASLALFGAVYFRRFGRDGLGLGDAKLFAAGGAWLGWQALPFVLLVASVGGLIFALAARRGRVEPRIAFGPWLALGIWLGWLGGGDWLAGG